MQSKDHSSIDSIQEAGSLLNKYSQKKDFLRECVPSYLENHEIRSAQVKMLVTVDTFLS